MLIFFRQQKNILLQKKCREISTNNEETRDKWVIKQLGELSAGLHILDAGAGTMRYAKYCKHLEYESQDFCQYDGQGDGVGCQNNSWDTKKIGIISEIDSIPRPDSSFDVILCTEVLEHVPNPIAAVKEFHRLLKPNGNFF